VTGGAQVIHPEGTALERESWCAYFDSLAHPRARLLVAVSLPGPDGDAGWEDGDRPLHGINYNHVSDEIEVAARLGPGSGASLRYFVGEPRAIVVAETAPQVTLLQVTDASGAQTLIRLRRSPSGRTFEPRSHGRSNRPPRSRIGYAPDHG
jgi:hypothetical protein